MENKQSPGRRFYAYWIPAFSAVITLLLLVQSATLVGRPSQGQSTLKTAVTDDYKMALQNRLSTALDGVVDTKKEYWIGKDAVVAPAPRQSNFGSTTEGEEIRKVIIKAASLLDGQSLYFNPEVERFNDAPVEYYRDDTILSITWKQDIAHTVYTFTEVKIGHPSQFRRFLSGGEFGSGKLYTCSEMAASVNAVMAASADYYAYRPAGITIYNGEIKRNNPGMTDICYIDDKGNLLLERDQQKLTNAEVQSYIDAHNINFSLAFGPILVKDGEAGVPDKYYFGEINENYARAAICQLGELHYLILNANEELGAWHWPNLKELLAVVETTGCTQAYTLDGGQTATTVVNNRVINHVSYGSERNISDIIYFATAIPDGG